MNRTEQQSRKKAEMHVGVQGIGTSPKELAFLLRHGVTHMDASVGDTETETLIQHKAGAAEAGVSLEMIHIGLQGASRLPKIHNATGTLMLSAR